VHSAAGWQVAAIGTPAAQAHHVQLVRTSRDRCMYRVRFRSRYVATVADALRRRRLAQPPSGG